jgi:hypothetical protein
LGGIASSLEQSQSPCGLFDLKQKEVFLREKGLKTAKKRAKTGAFLRPENEGKSPVMYSFLTC